MLKCISDIGACSDRQTRKTVAITPLLCSPLETKNKVEPKPYLVWVDEVCSDWLKVKQVCIRQNY